MTRSAGRLTVPARRAVLTLMAIGITAGTTFGAAATASAAQHTGGSGMREVFSVPCAVTQWIPYTCSKPLVADPQITDFCQCTVG